MISAETGVTQGGGLTLFGESEKCTQLGVTWGIPDHSTVKNLPTRQETRSQGFDPWVGKIPWRGEWPPTPVFLPGKSHGQRSLAGHRPWSCKELDTTEHGAQRSGTSAETRRHWVEPRAGGRASPHPPPREEPVPRPAVPKELGASKGRKDCWAEASCTPDPIGDGLQRQLDKNSCGGQGGFWQGSDMTCAFCKAYSGSQVSIGGERKCRNQQRLPSRARPDGGLEYG